MFRSWIRRDCSELSWDRGNIHAQGLVFLLLFCMQDCSFLRLCFSGYWKSGQTTNQIPSLIESKTLQMYILKTLSISALLPLLMQHQSSLAAHRTEPLWFNKLCCTLLHNQYSIHRSHACDGKALWIELASSHKYWIFVVKGKKIKFPTKALTWVMKSIGCFFSG